MLISNDGEKYSPEGIEEALVDHSDLIDQSMLYNNQNAYTTGLIVVNPEAMRSRIRKQNLDPKSAEGVEAAVKLIYAEVENIDAVGDLEQSFPKRWLPAAIAILDEPFTEENGMINSTLKMVRNKVAEHFSERINHLYSADGKNPMNEMNKNAMRAILNRKHKILMNSKRTRNIVLLVLLAISIFMIVMPKYALRALYYQLPGLDDYKIFYNRTIEAGEYHPWDMHPEYNQAKLSEAAVEGIESYETVAFLIIKDQQILHEMYWDGYDENSLSNSFSMAKSIVSFLIGAAIDEGKIKSVDQKVGDFIPSFKKGGKKDITIRHLLTMSSGTDWDEAYSSLFSPTTESYYGDDLKGMVDRLKSVKTPGVEYYYASIDTEALAMVVEAATGKNISTYTSEKFWQRLGPKHDAVWNLDKEEGLEKAYCCFNSNARDFARWGQLVLNHGSWDGEQLLSEEYVKQATSPADYLVDETGENIDYYGYQWWIINYEGHQIPYMRGILGQYVFAIPEKNAVVVRLGHKRSDELIGPNRKDIYVYLDAAFEILN